MKKVLYLLLSILMLTGSVVVAADAYTPGVYTGVSTNGRNGTVKVEVAFSADAITSVTVTEHAETIGISDAAITQIPAAIVEAQSLGVDVIGGATISSKAIIEAVADAVNQAGGDAAALAAIPVEKKISDEIIEMETNVVVVGGGAAGLSAAITLACEGEDQIILLEKEASLGGNAIRSGGFIEYLNAPDEIAIETNDGYNTYLEELIAAGPQDDSEAMFWDALVAKYNEWKASDSKKLFDCGELLCIDYHRVEGVPAFVYDGYADLVNAFDEWFVNEIGGKYAKQVGIVGYTYPRWVYPEGFERGTGYFYYLQKYLQAKNLPIDIKYNTPATELITNETGRVTGVKALADDGTQYIITAKKGVLLATGGFSANSEMLAQYDEQWGIEPGTIVKHDNNPGDTGDGIIMAQKIGAALDSMSSIMMFPQGDVVGTNDVLTVSVFNGSSNLFVNKEGKRFVDETASRFEISHAVFQLDEPIYYIITDSLNSGLEATEEELALSAEHGAMYHGDTIADLAAAMGVDPTVLEATVAQYNEACATFQDDLFGRTTFAEGSEIVQGPFYATPRTPVAHITIGGVATDANGCVLTENGEAIEGLYAAGEVVSGSCGISAFAYGRGTAKYILDAAK